MVRDFATPSAHGLWCLDNAAIHSPARSTGDFGCAGVLHHLAAASRGDSVPQVLRQDGLYPLHGDVEPAAIDDDAADQDGFALDGELEIHHCDSGILLEFL